MLAYHALLLALLVGSTVLSTLLSVLNVRHGARELRANAAWVETYLDVDDPDEIVAYQRATTGMSLVRSWMTLVLLLGALYAGVVSGAVRLLEATGLHPIAQGVTFFMGLFVAARIVAAPFELYSTFVIDELFGFNETTPQLWLRDFVVGLLVGVALLGALAGGLLALIESLPTATWIGGGWLLLVAFILGIVLGSIAEENFLRSLDLSDGSLLIFLGSWPSRLLVLLTLFVLLVPFLKASRERSSTSG